MSARPSERSSKPTPLDAGAEIRETGAVGRSDRILVFTLEGQEYGVPLDSVVEIIRHRAATPVPGASPTIEGILPFRGRMVTLFCGRRRLGLEERPSGSSGRVIILDDDGELVGLIVDSVARVASESEREPLPEALGLKGTALYEGTIRQNGRFILLLNMARVLSADRNVA
jgi:purine-binding chemotaxis protein CheW